MQIVSQRGIRQVRPEQNGCMAVGLGLGNPALLTAQERFQTTAAWWRLLVVQNA